MYLSLQKNFFLVCNLLCVQRGQLQHPSESEQLKLDTEIKSQFKIQAELLVSSNPIFVTFVTGISHSAKG